MTVIRYFDSALESPRRRQELPDVDTARGSSSSQVRKWQRHRFHSLSLGKGPRDVVAVIAHEARRGDPLARAANGTGAYTQSRRNKFRD